MRSTLDVVLVDGLPLELSRLPSSLALSEGKAKDSSGFCERSGVVENFGKFGRAFDVTLFTIQFWEEIVRDFDWSSDPTEDVGGSE